MGLPKILNPGKWPGHGWMRGGAKDQPSGSQDPHRGATGQVSNPAGGTIIPSHSSLNVPGKNGPGDSHDRARVPQPQGASVEGTWQSQGVNPNGIHISTRPAYDNGKRVGNEVQSVDPKTGKVTTFNPINNKSIVTEPWKGNAPGKTNEISQTVQPSHPKTTEHVPVVASGSSGSGPSLSVAPNPTTTVDKYTPKPKVQFKTAANGDLLQKVEGGNWYVAKDNPDPVNSVTSASEGMNKRYGLGEYSSPTPSEALAARSEGMNEKYGLGEYATPTPAVVKPVYGGTADMIAARIQNDQNGVSSPLNPTDRGTVDMIAARIENNSHPSTGPAWHANPNWEATSDASAAVISASGVDPSNVLETRSGANSNTLLRMKDGTYLSIESGGNVNSAGHWDNSQWANSEYATSAPAASVTAAVESTSNVEAAATATAPQPTAPDLSRYGEEVQPTNLTRQWAEDHRPTEPSPAVVQPQPSAAPAPPSIEYSIANQYSGNVDMAEIERSIAAIHNNPAPITLPGGGVSDPAGIGGLDGGSSGGDYLNPGRVAGHGRHYAE